MKPTIEDLRIDSAKAFGVYLKVNDNGDVITLGGNVWQPDKDPAQLVKCIEWLRQVPAEVIIGAQDWDNFDVQVTTPDGVTTNYKGEWRACIMHAVAEVGNDNS